jgi:indolepyruvate decarboxylase
VINPDNCVIEMERLIAEARSNNQPAYIVVPSDYALASVNLTEVRPATLKSNETSIERAVAAIAERLRNAKSVVALPAFTVSRLRLQKEARQAIEALGCPFATTSMEKCIIDESHPRFAGLYAGALSAEKTRHIVEDAELVLDLGGISLNDESTLGFSGRLDSARFISIGLMMLVSEHRYLRMCASLTCSRHSQSSNRQQPRTGELQNMVQQ